MQKFYLGVKVFLIALVVLLITLFAAYLRIEYARNIVIEKPLSGDAGQYYTYGYNLFKQGDIYIYFLNLSPLLLSTLRFLR